MWSDAARASSMQARMGQGGPASGGSAAVGPAGNVSGGGQGIQSRLAQAGANSRGQWGGKSKGTHEHVTITGAAHQAGVNAITPNMKSGGKPLDSLPPAYYPNVASSSYGYGSAGMPGL